MKSQLLGSQTEVVTAAPPAGFASRFLEQDLPCVRQQAQPESPNAPDASGARDENDSSRARDATMARRANQQLCTFPGIPLGVNYIMRHYQLAGRGASW